MIPITANLASSESMMESPSSSFGVELIGETNELKMQAPIAIPTGASVENSARHVPFLSFLYRATQIFIKLSYKWGRGEKWNTYTESEFISSIPLPGKAFPEGGKYVRV